MVQIAFADSTCFDCRQHVNAASPQAPHHGVLCRVFVNVQPNLAHARTGPVESRIFNASYWPTFDDAYSPMPGRDVAKVLELVRKNKPKKPLWYTSKMSAEAVLKLEDENNRKCIEYARQMPTM